MEAGGVTHCRDCEALRFQLDALRTELGVRRADWLAMHRTFGLERRKAQILAMLWAARGRPVSREFLLAYGLGENSHEGTLRTHVCAIRRLLRLEIPNVLHFGYALGPTDLMRIARSLTPADGTDAEHATVIGSPSDRGEAVQALRERSAADSPGRPGTGQPVGASGEAAKPCAR